jgi:hypothetical protein
VAARVRRGALIVLRIAAIKSRVGKGRDLALTAETSRPNRIQLHKLGTRLEARQVRIIPRSREKAKAQVVISEPGQLKIREWLHPLDFALLH